MNRTNKNKNKQTNRTELNSTEARRPTTPYKPSRIETYTEACTHVVYFSDQQFHLETSYRLTDERAQAHTHGDICNVIVKKAHESL
jgi:hypothetical protein